MVKTRQDSNDCLPACVECALPAAIKKVEQYFGSFVRLNAISSGGAPFEMRVYLADWVLLDEGGATVADSQGPGEANNPYLSELIGMELLELVPRGRHELQLAFSNGAALTLMANLDQYEFDDELLIVALDEAYVKFSPSQGFVVGPPIVVGR